jgi:dihydroxy-acid dehydratase
MHLNDLAKHKNRVWKEDLVGLIFNTIGVSDGMSNGTDAFSLVSRDVIADSIETVVGAQWYDGVIAILAAICQFYYGHGKIKSTINYGIWR